MTGQNIRPDICVGIDATNLRQGGGITHLAELLNELKPEELRISRVFVWAGSAMTARLPNFPWLIKETPPALEGSLLRRIFWQLFSLSRCARFARCDVLFVPGGSYLGSFSPVVTMSQNLLPFEFTELKRSGISLFTLKMLILRLVQSFTFRRSDGVVFLTDYARSVVLKATGKIRGLTCVIGHGVAKNFYSEPKAQQSIKEYSVTNPFQIIYVSTVDAYKHQLPVIEAMQVLRDRGYPVKLIMIGSAAKHSLNLVNKVLEGQDASKSTTLNLRDEYLGVIPYDKLLDHYRQSDLAVFASSCETFGIILVEKMSVGLPIACSKISCMGEILLDGGLYFDPLDPDSIANSIEQYLLSPQLREENIKKSQRRALEFTWAISARQTFEFIVKVVKTQRGQL
jgi:glycosyltransferase involved in cell wall biosynthesis